LHGNRSTQTCPMRVKGRRTSIPAGGGCARQLPPATDQARKFTVIGAWCPNKTGSNAGWHRNPCDPGQHITAASAKWLGPVKVWPIYPFVATT